MARVNKETIMNGLKLIASKVAFDVEAQSQIDYTVDSYEENPRNVTMDEVKEVVNLVEEATGKKFLQLMDEAKQSSDVVDEKSTKRPLPSKAKDKEAVVENKEKEKPVIAVKKDKVEPTEEKVETKTTKTTKKEAKPEMDFLASFPDTLESKSLKATLKKRPDLKTIGDVAKAFANDEDIIIATYWTDKLLKQYSQGYDPMNINPNRPKKFEHDLDLVEVTHAHDLVVTGHSLYSMVPQILLPQDFEADENGMRYANGCEFEVYEVVDEDGEDQE